MLLGCLILFIINKEIEFEGKLNIDSYGFGLVLIYSILLYCIEAAFIGSSLFPSAASSPSSYYISSCSNIINIMIIILCRATLRNCGL